MKKSDRYENIGAAMIFLAMILGAVVAWWVHWIALVTYLAVLLSLLASCAMSLAEKAKAKEKEASDE